MLTFSISFSTNHTRDSAQPATITSAKWRNGVATARGETQGWVNASEFCFSAFWQVEVESPEQETHARAGLL
jgi:hypothetical protein